MFGCFTVVLLCVGYFAVHELIVVCGYVLDLCFVCEFCLFVCLIWIAVRLILSLVL